MLYRSNQHRTHTRQRSNSHPVTPLRFRTPSEINEDAPVRPPRNPARPSTLGQELQGPLPFVASDCATASRDGCREGEIENERYRPTVDAPLSESLVKSKQKAREVPLPQINTLDRKILQELKQSMLARSAQFALKNNVRHHPFPSDQVPYPRSYDHKCLDTDVWETVFCEQYCGNITFHNFDVPPTKVLDLGCGSGSWTMACARRWKNCHFVGVDIVPLHPDLGRSELGRRVSWVQANFLEPLPFPNEEFDFVHIKRIARGVPEHKWDALFEEIIRVMKPGAVLEMLEEDLYIPGQMMDPIDNDSIYPASPCSSSPEEFSLPQQHVPHGPRPSTSLPDIAASYSSFQTIRRSISERRKTQPPASSQTTPDTFPPPLPTQPIPPNTDLSRVFPRPRASKPTTRPIGGHFKLHKLLPKRSVREDGADTDADQPRKTKKESLVSASLFDLHRPSTSGGTPKPYLNKSGTSSNSTLKSNRTLHAPPPIPSQELHRFGEEDLVLSLPRVESPSDYLGVDFLQGDDSSLSLSRQFSNLAPEDDRKPPPNILSSLNSGFFYELEPVDQWEEKPIIPPAPPPKDIPGRLTPLTLSLTPSSSDISSSATNLSLSGPGSRFTDQSDHVEDQLLSPSSDLSGRMKYPLNTSPAASTSCSTGQAPPPSSRWSDDSMDNRPRVSTTPEMPPNPRQHKLLDVIYTEMHAARSVNLAPVRLIENRIRMHFKDVHARAPLMFTFPPPPGCQHRPESDAAELRQRKSSLLQKAEHDDGQNRHPGPDTRPTLSPLISAFPLPPGCENRPESDGIPPLTQPEVPRPSSFKSTSSRSIRERSNSVTSNDPGPSRARSSSVKSDHSFTADPEAFNHRQPNFRGYTIRPGDGPIPDRAFFTGEGLGIGRSEHAVVDTSAIGGFYPTRVAGDDRERSRQRSDSLSARSTDVKGKGVSGEPRQRFIGSGLALTRPSTAGSIPPPSAFVYKNPNATSSSSSITSSSLNPRRDSGKGKLSLTMVDRAQSNALANKKIETSTRSLSLHLRVRVVEILGCSEIMWDWVREFQSRELEKERKHKEKLALAAKSVQGVGGGRVAYYHHDRVRNRGGRGKTDGGQPTVAPKSSKEPLSPASSKTKSEPKPPTPKTKPEPKPPTPKTSKQPAPPPTKASGEKPAKPVRRMGGGRVSYFHQPARKPVPARERANSTSTGTTSIDRPQRSYTGGTRGKAPSLYSATSSGSGKTDDPHDRMENSLKQELRHMTRQRFDEMLSWFQFDMDDSIRLSRSMTMRGSCAPFPTEPSDQRKAFEEACQKLEDHFQLYPKQAATLIGSGGSIRGSHCGEEELCCMPPLLNLVHPSKRLCRTIRVWVAWKP